MVLSPKRKKGKGVGVRWACTQIAAQFPGGEGGPGGHNGHKGQHSHVRHGWCGRTPRLLGQSTKSGAILREAPRWPSRAWKMRERQMGRPRGCNNCLRGIRGRGCGHRNSPSGQLCAAHPQRWAGSASLSVALPTDETIFWSHPTRLAPGFLWPDSDSMQVEIRPLHEAGAAAGSTGRRYRVSWEDNTRTVRLEAQDNNLGRLGPLRLPRAIKGGSFEWGLFNGEQCTLLLYGRGFSQPEPYDIVFSGHVHGACGLPFARGLGERTVGPKHWGRRGKEKKPLMLSGLGKSTSYVWAANSVAVTARSL